MFPDTDSASDLMPSHESMLEEANVRLQLDLERARLRNLELGLELSRLRGQCLVYERALGLGPQDQASEMIAVARKALGLDRRGTAPELLDTAGRKGRAA